MGALQRPASEASLISNIVKDEVWQMYKFVNNRLLQPNGSIAKLVAYGMGMQHMIANDYNQWAGIWINSLRKTVREKLGEKRGNCSQNLRKACHGKPDHEGVAWLLCYNGNNCRSSCGSSTYFFDASYCFYLASIKKKTLPEWDHLRKIWDPEDKNVQEAFKFVCRELLQQVVGQKHFKKLLEHKDQDLTDNVDESSFGFIYHELEREYKNYQAEVEAEKEREKQQESLSDLSSTSSSSSFRKRGVNRRFKGGDELRQKLYLDWTTEASEKMEEYKQEVNKAFEEVRTDIEMERDGNSRTEGQKRKKKTAESDLEIYERKRKFKKGALLSRVSSILYRQEKNERTITDPAQVQPTRMASL